MQIQYGRRAKRTAALRMTKGDKRRFAKFAEDLRQRAYDLRQIHAAFSDDEQFGAVLKAGHEGALATAAALDRVLAFVDSPRNVADPDQKELFTVEPEAAAAK